jgi:hypothetical protein
MTAVYLPPPVAEYRGIVSPLVVPSVSIQVSMSRLFDAVVMVDAKAPTVPPNTVELRPRKPGEAGGRLLMMGTPVSWPTDADDDY